MSDQRTSNQGASQFLEWLMTPEGQAALQKAEAASQELREKLVESQRIPWQKLHEPYGARAAVEPKDERWFAEQVAAMIDRVEQCELQDEDGPELIAMLRAVPTKPIDDLSTTVPPVVIRALGVSNEPTALALAAWRVRNEAKASLGDYSLGNHVAVPREALGQLCEALDEKEPAEPPVLGWQPMSTAPRDRNILVWNDYFGCYITRYKEYKGDQWPLSLEAHLRMDYELAWYPVPRAWMHLPIEPERRTETKLVEQP